MCTDGGNCYDKPDAGEKCNDGKGPTKDVCSSDCTACGTTLDTTAPTTTPAPTAEVSFRVCLLFETPEREPPDFGVAGVR